MEGRTEREAARRRAGPLPGRSGPLPGRRTGEGGREPREGAREGAREGPSALVQALAALQGASGWHDGEFVARLVKPDGDTFARSYWVRIKLGDRHPGVDFLGAVRRGYPCFREAVDRYLDGGGAAAGRAA
jgi:hypothetical protein